MATMSIQTIETRVTKVDNEGQARSRQLANRSENLSSHAHVRYVLSHTATIDGAEYVTFVDTLTRVND
ncbi:hypothetical protein PA27867_3899 (plasmid) [Cryobacterium arcticum]|uniref:Uncharacterized protein n=2 Tax=Cryobacterium arcticum TaxID=670052 RepID=A0A1B1BQQ8_9MICO|nr:hypothetical protein PA27867_3899 [Cryobacterium arcticum]